VAEQRYRAVLAVIGDGRTVTEVAAAVGVSRQSLHSWLARYEADGGRGGGVGGASAASVVGCAADCGRAWPAGVITGKSSIQRCLRRSGLIDPDTRRRRRKDWKR
jgi:helix-turn-helix protein